LGIIDIMEDSEDQMLACEIRPIYEPENGRVIVYAGDLQITVNGVTRTISGDIELLFDPSLDARAHIAGTETWLSELIFSSEFPEVAVPAGASLAPPTDSGLAVPPSDASWYDRPFPVNHVEAGDLGQVERLIVHIIGQLSKYPLPGCQTAGGYQGQLSFSLPGWKLRLAAVEGTADGFTYVAVATPDQLPIDQNSVDILGRRMFALMSLVANREIGVGPIVGLDSAGEITWAQWGAPRYRPGSSPIRWCPKSRVNETLPAIAAGLCRHASNPGLDAIIYRAINHLLAADGPQTLDVRIPVACSGLELLAWAVLQHHQWLTPDALGKLSAGATVRLLLHWAGIPVSLPTDFSALAARRGRLGLLPDSGGPELLFNVRNGLVHPPKKLTQPEWP
jgi:hypothetical protein